MAVKLHTGLFRSVVQFKVNIPTQQGAGYEDQYYDYGETRGYLKRKGSGRNVVTGEIETSRHFELYTRYWPYYANKDLMIVIDGREFTIHAVDTLEEGRTKYMVYTIAEKL